MGERNNPEAERNIAALLAAWRAKRLPIVHVQHMSTESRSTLRPELPGNAIKPEALPLPGETIFRKTASCAFVGTALEEHLRGRQIDSLVVVGLTTDQCVSSTTRMASDLGFKAIVVADGTATFERRGADGERHPAEQMHRTALATLQEEFATIRKTRDVLAEVDALGSASASEKSLR